MFVCTNIARYLTISLRHLRRTQILAYYFMPQSLRTSKGTLLIIYPVIHFFYGIYTLRKRGSSVMSLPFSYRYRDISYKACFAQAWNL